MIEKKLREAPLRAPSARLDHRIRTAIEEAEVSRRRPFFPPIPLWAGAAACVVFAVLGFFTSQLTGTAQPPAQPEQVLIYVVEPTQPMLELVHSEDAGSTRQFFQTKKTNVRNITPLSGRPGSVSL